MLRVSAWSIAIPLILLSIGFIFIGTIGYAMIPEPDCPPPPHGTQTVVQHTRQSCVQVPRLTDLTVIDTSEFMPKPARHCAFDTATICG
jgi:hypothetical protein